MEQKIYSDDIKRVASDLDAARASVQSEILEIKSDLLSVYLMNLVLYKEMSEEDRVGSPVVEMLGRTSILLEKICLMEKKADAQGRVPLEEGSGQPKKETATEDDKRVITEEMKRNKFVKKKRKAEDRIPRLKYRNRAAKLAERAEAKHDGNIDGSKGGGNRFG